MPLLFVTRSIVTSGKQSGAGQKSGEREWAVEVRSRKTMEREQRIEGRRMNNKIDKKCVHIVERSQRLL